MTCLCGHPKGQHTIKVVRKGYHKSICNLCYCDHYIGILAEVIEL